MSGCDREQGTHFMCDCMRERMIALEEALNRIAHRDYNDLAGDPLEWSTTIAKQALGWAFRDGKQYPPDLSRQAEPTKPENQEES